MLPDTENLNLMLNNAMAGVQEFFTLPFKMGMAFVSSITGGQRQWDVMNYGQQDTEPGPAYGSHPGFPEGIWERRDRREGITPGERELQKNQIAKKTSEAGIYVYVPPGAPEGDPGTIFF